MTQPAPPARPASGAIFASGLALALGGLPTAGHATTTLQQLLAVIDANPMLVFGGLYMNYSEILSYDPQITTLQIDGSVIIAHHGAITPSEQATTPGTGPVTEPAEPLQWAPLEISTNVIGGSNAGTIDVDHSFYLASQPGRNDTAMMLPGRAIVAINATSTQAQVTGSVTMLSDGSAPTVTNIKTSAIGASNVGSITVLLSNGVSQSEGR
jgi:hypothetical protein